MDQAGLKTASGSSHPMPRTEEMREQTSTTASTRSRRKQVRNIISLPLIFHFISRSPTCPPTTLLIAFIVCKVVKINTKHVFPGIMCRPNPPCPPKLYCEYYSHAPISSNGTINYEVELASGKQYYWAEKLCYTDTGD
jgi:hypothetical protein